MNYSPELIGIAKYNTEMSEWLTSRGHEVSVVCSKPYYPDWRVFKGFSAWSYSSEVINGVKVLRCPIWVPRIPGGIRRILHQVSFAISSLPRLIAQIRYKPNIVMVIEPPLVISPVSMLVARLCGAKSWLHVQDLEVDAATNLGLIKSRPIVAFAYWLERKMLKQFDMVSSISKPMLDKLRNKGVCDDKLVFFPNWVDTCAIRPTNDDFITNKKILSVPSDKVIALYSGNMGNKQGLDVLVAAALSDKIDPALHFVFCGEGSSRHDLMKQAHGLDNITWLPLQPVDAFNELLNIADIHLLPQKKDAEDIVLPSKLTSMMACGRPIVATASAGSQICQTILDCGVCVEPGNLIDFLAALNHLAEDIDERKRLGKNSRLYAEKYLDKEMVLLDFESQLDR